MILLIIIFCRVLAIYAQGAAEVGYVEEVSCSAEGLTIMLNATDPDISRWLKDPKSKPIIYVTGHRTRAECGSLLKKDQGLVNLNFTIPYGKKCDVHLTKLEPHYRSAETMLVLEDDADLSFSKVVRSHHVFCIYTRSVQTLRYNDVATGNEKIASTGGKPKPKVEMFFRNADGPLRAAKLGDTVEFYITLAPDNAYHGIVPKECRFSDREDMQSPDAMHLTFVQSSCPVNDVSEVIDPLASVNSEVYVSKFKTFRFDNKTTVFVHCTVQVCLFAHECEQNCFTKVHNSNLTAERLRFRHKRQTTYDEIAVKNTLTILDDAETKQVAAPSVEQCRLSSPDTQLPVLLIIAALSILSVTSTSALVYVVYKRRKANKESFDVYSSYGGASMMSAMANTNTMTASYQPSFSQRTHPYVHHMGMGDGSYR